MPQMLVGVVLAGGRFVLIPTRQPTAWSATNDATFRDDFAADGS